jgi:hypothetical protein
MLPAARASEGGAPFLSALFTATSAVCVTGLAVQDTPAYWFGLGQVIILGHGGKLLAILDLMLDAARECSSRRDRLCVKQGEAYACHHSRPAHQSRCRHA